MTAVACPHCSQSLELSPELAGKIVSCPYCQNQFMGPPAAAAARPAPPRTGMPPQMGMPPAAQNAFSAIGASQGGHAQSSPGSKQKPQLSRAQRQRLKTPATCIMIVAMLVMALAVVGILLSMVRLSSGPTHYEEYFYGKTWQTRYIIGIVANIVNIGLLAVAAIGASKMGQARDYGWAMTAAVIMVVPCWGASILGMPFGIWALIVLNDHELKRCFKSSRRKRY